MPFQSPMGFNPSALSLNDLASISPMKDAALGIYGSALSPEMKQQMMPMGMMNRTGQEFMGQQGGDANVGTENNPVNNAIYQMMAKGFQSLGNKAQQAIAPTQQIIRDNNQFRFAGMQQNPQMLAQALRKR